MSALPQQAPPLQSHPPADSSLSPLRPRSPAAPVPSGASVFASRLRSSGGSAAERLTNILVGVIRGAGGVCVAAVAGRVLLALLALLVLSRLSAG